MLPILPALLLLILQGPSSIEKMALEGRLPAALEAIGRQMESKNHRVGALDSSNEAVLATLWAFSGDPGLSKALYKLLTLDQEQDSDTQSPSVLSVETDESPTAFPNGRHGPLPGQFSECQRSRDGPI